MASVPHDRPTGPAPDPAPTPGTRRRLVARLFAWAGLVLVSGLVALTGEALVRARLANPADRIPSAIYSRSEPWGGGQDAQPVLIGFLPDSPRERREPVALDELPRHLVDAVLAVEDQRFGAHRGFDLRRIAGAALANLRAREVTQGGSTITQQLAKNLFLSARRTPVRKLREAFLARALEDRYPKTVILEAYLNEIYLGQDGGAALIGVGAASRYYFGKPAARLSLSESATLAGMIRSPNRTTPTRHPDAAQARRNLVLGMMAAQGRIEPREAERAADARLRARARPLALVDARYFEDAVGREVRRLRGRMPSRGAVVSTTLDARLQQAAQRAVKEGLRRLRQPEAEAALVALDPRTGDVLALVGGRDYARSQFNRATDARRQPGSAFKPVVALAALGRSGQEAPAFTLASAVRDEPFQVGRGSQVWSPVNYDGSFRGPVSVREALEQSLNVPFARIGLEVGPDRIAAVGARLGIASDLRAVPSLSLGSSEVTLLELVRAYGVLAAGGMLHETRLVARSGSVGEGTADARPMGRQVADPAEAYLVTSALEGAVQRGTGRALASMGRRGGLAGKSGTSSDWRDAWFVAYTPSLVVGVWVGYDDGRSLDLPGASAALPIVGQFLRAAYPRGTREAFPVPDGIVRQTVAHRDGWWWSCDGEPEVFLAGTEPEETCGGFRWPDGWSARIELDWDEVEDLLDRYGIELDGLVERMVERLSGERSRLNRRGQRRGGRP